MKKSLLVLWNLSLNISAKFILEIIISNSLTGVTNQIGYQIVSGT